MTPVNFGTRPQVNRQLSAQGLTVLRALAATPAEQGDGYLFEAGELTVAELVRCLRQPGVKRTITRASLSRTLRRLWRDGLVELSTECPWMATTMTEEQQKNLTRLASAEADPVAFYESFKALGEGLGVNWDTYGSAEAYLVAMREKYRRPLFFRATRVQITAAGRDRLTPSPGEQVNRVTHRVSKQATTEQRM